MILPPWHRNTQSMIRWVFLILFSAFGFGGAFPSGFSTGFPAGFASAETATWRGTLLHEAAQECQALPNFERLLAYYYTALRADPTDEVNLRALRDFSALALRHGDVSQAAFLFESHVAHNGGRPASSAVTQSLVNSYLRAGQRDALLSLIFAPPNISPRTLAEIKFMTVVGLAAQGEAWVAYELARRNPGLFDGIDLDFAFYIGAVKAQNAVLIDRFDDQMELIELRAYRAGLAADFNAYFDFANLPEARRVKAIAAFAYGLTFRDLSPPFDQVVAPLRDFFDPALIANVFARMGRPSWAVHVLSAANAAPQFGAQVYADIPLADELVRLGAERELVSIHNQQYLDSAPGLAVSLMRTGLYDLVPNVLSGLSNQEIEAINPLLVLAIYGNGDAQDYREDWADTPMRAHLFDNLGQFAPAFAEEERVFRAFLRGIEQNNTLTQDQRDFNLNLLTNLLELEGFFDRAAASLSKISSPDLRLRAANSLTQAISHRCFGGQETTSPFYPFTLGDLNLDADYRHRTLKVF